MPSTRTVNSSTSKLPGFASRFRSADCLWFRHNTIEMPLRVNANESYINGRFYPCGDVEIGPHGVFVGGTRVKGVHRFDPWLVAGIVLLATTLCLAAGIALSSRCLQ